MSEPHFLYRLRDSEGRLLYVGFTRHVQQRMAAHRSEQPWWPLVADREVEQHPDRASAERAEKEALATEAPAFNVLHTAGRKEARATAPFRTICVPNDPWLFALLAAQDRGDSIHDVVTEALRQYVTPPPS